MNIGGHKEDGSAGVFDVESIMVALARRKTARITKESVSLEVAFEIREIVPDSKLLVGVPLGQGDDTIEIDILGLVNGRKLAVRISNGEGSREDCLRALADIRQLCAVDPDLAGLALAIVPGRGMPEDIGDPWPAWRSLPTAAGDGGVDVKYAYAWASPDPLPGDG